MRTLPERHRDRARGRPPADHGRQLALVGARGRARGASRGKGIVNSISLKEGEEPFLAQARRIRDYGAGGRRDGLRRGGAGDRRRAARRDLRARLRPAHRQVGFAPEDLIFDPNILAVATGIAEHDGYAQSFLEALPRDQGALPRVAHERRHLEPQLLVPRQRRSPRGDARRLPLPRDRAPASTWGSSTPASSPVVEDVDPGAARADRGRAASRAGPTRPTGSSRSPSRCGARRRRASATSPGARLRSPSGSSHALVHGIVAVEVVVDTARLARLGGVGGGAFRRAAAMEGEDVEARLTGLERDVGEPADGCHQPRVVAHGVRPHPGAEERCDPAELEGVGVVQVHRKRRLGAPCRRHRPEGQASHQPEHHHQRQVAASAPRERGAQQVPPRRPCLAVRHRVSV